MKKAIVIVVLLLLAGGAGGWWFFLRAPPPPALHPQADAAPTYMPLAPITISVVNESRIVGQVTIELTLALRNGQGQQDVTQALPRLTDAIIVELHALLGRRLMAEEGYPLPLIKERLMGVATRVVGADVVSDVLIKTMSQHQRG